MVERRPQHAISKLAFLCCPLPYRVAPVFVQVVSPSLGGLPCRILLSYCLQVVTREVHRPSLRRLICPAQDHFIFSYSGDYIYDLCPLLDPDVGLSVVVCDIEHTYFHIGMCLVSVHVSAPHVIANAHMICIPVSSGKPACHDSSLYLFVVVLFLEAVVLSQVHVALNIFYQQIVHVYRGVVYNHHICLCDVHLKTHSPTFIGQFFSICCSSCGVSVHMNMSSAKRILGRNSPSIFTPLFSQFNLLNKISSVAVNSLVEMVSPVLLLY